MGLETPELIVTTTNKANREAVDAAHALAARYGLRFVSRESVKITDNGGAGSGVNAFSNLQEISPPLFLIVGNEQLFLQTPSGKYHFHPGMAALRIKRLVAGETDTMVSAMGLHPGDAVLDCTLGLGGDAIVAGHAVGDAGRVVGLESVLSLAILVKEGLAHYHFGYREIDEAMRRVTAHHASNHDYLARLPDRSFDVVYFDPMFRVTVNTSQGMLPLRELGNPGRVTKELVAQARRAARRRVVLKERRGSAEFARLGFTNLAGGRSSHIAYGYIERND